MLILGIDPGPEESALVEYDTLTKRPVWFGKLPNSEAGAAIECSRAEEMCVEMIASYGMPVGAEVFETCVWIGRFTQRWLSTGAKRDWIAKRIFRREVKVYLCNSMKATDTNVRAALIDRYGGKEKAIGKKAAPGPLYGISGDVWSALAVAITYAEGEK